MVLDQGHVEFIESWGSDERIIEAARMSTSKGFQGWGRHDCLKCGVTVDGASTVHDGDGPDGQPCDGEVVYKPGDEKLLAYLWKHNHMTPFEMAGATFIVKAPLFVFREWHRHRTQSYNEMSARYVPLPDDNYVPTMERIKGGVALAKGNRQAQGAVEFNETMAAAWLDHLTRVYDHAQSIYEMGINAGVPKELARLCVPVARYSRMMVSTDLRNWLAFCKLRCTRFAPGAQWEIRQYADAVENELCLRFPRTMRLFIEGAL
jgi:thymidylate synthase (FAD)